MLCRPRHRARRVRTGLPRGGRAFERSPDRSGRWVMRIVFTTQPAYGHFYPMLPIAAAARRAGHDAAWSRCFPNNRLTTSLSTVRRLCARTDRMSVPSLRSARVSPARGQLWQIIERSTSWRDHLS
jgi:hypothetical protein